MLKYWLPLCGDLHNQGLDEVVVTNNGATTNDNGKIGKCYYFDGNAHWLQFDRPLGDFYNNDFSLAVWLKPTDSTRSIILSEYSASGASNVAFELTTARVIRVYWNGSPDINATAAGGLTLNEWSHIAIVKTNGVIKFYINGVLKYTYTGTLSSRTSNANPRIGDDYRGGTGVSYQGYMNDFRLYSHALSPKEVKEISKGLVLHYPLNRGGFGGDNLLKNTNVFTNWWWKKSTKWSATNGMLKALNTGSTTNQFFETWSGIGTKTDLENKTIAISFDIMSPSWSDVKDANNFTGLPAVLVQISSSNTAPSATGNGGSLLNYTFSRIGDNTRGNWTIPNNISDNVWLHCEDVLTLDTSTWQTYGSGTVGNYFYLAFQLRMNGEIYIKNVKVELGNHATPWVPNPSDALYSSMGLNSNIEYDVSGYQNNGTITGTLNYSSDTPKYSVSTTFDGTQKIVASSFTSEIKTMSVWVKTTKDKNTSQFVCADSASKLCISFYKGCIISYFASSGHSTGSKCTLGSSYIENGWNHIVVVSTGSGTRDVYCNGVKLTPTTNDYWSYTPAGFTVGARNSNTPYYFYGYISDFRAYATALSVDDILALYHTPASIASNGVLMTQGEIAEV